ncbi:class I SAM-dependent methyltransferase [Streptomyces sp. NBC_01306]|uniref:class I SAM-dependent methyltransferase n=1 Tax=Streptomyces sp. NBC_01306 TaxID=2903819 RepID=UPI00225C1CD4|nr:class I SAM-dependent methyltransferase [Streptomyces sp. NBC_01306]MCX4728086.1 class I SAM-dependent methyltransferase [Streptomyces sp. NBC_01306]
MTGFDETGRSIWSGRAVAYAESFAAVCAHPVDELLDAVGAGPDTDLLDVGTGSGNVAAGASARGARVTAVDAEPGMVELAAKAVPLADVGVAELPALPFADDAFDAVTANFVLDHVGWPQRALAELGRVSRPGGRIAVTVWSVPAGPGQALLGRAMEAAGVQRPVHRPVLAPETDFPRTEQGLEDLLLAAGLSRPSCRTIAWNHRTSAQEWWHGAASGVGFTGHLIAAQPPRTRAEIKRHFDRLSGEFTGPDGRLALPHRALLAGGTG